MRNISSLLFVFVFTFSLHINAQEVLNLEKNELSANGSLEDLKWMVGYWTGTGLGGECDELWLPAMDNSMMGTSRLMIEGELIFSEFMTIVEEEGRLSVKLKHFGRDLSPWEEKENWTVFRFIKTENQTAYFDGITYHRRGNEMVIKLSLDNNGIKSIEEFKFTRKEL